MGKASSSKKVARAARTGGGRTKKGASTSWGWPVLVTTVVVLGVAIIIVSKQDQTAAAASPRKGEHWHAALGIDVCGEFLPPITDDNDPAGIHTHGDGVVHIHPNSATAEGERATLGKYFEAIKAKVNASEISLPGQPSRKEGEKCGDKPAVIRTKIWESRAPDARERVVTGNPSDIRFTNDGELITIALLPEDDDIPKPPSADQLDKLTDMPGASTVPPEVSIPPDGSLPPGVSLPPDAAIPPDASLPPDVSAPPGATGPPPADAGNTAPPASPPPP